VRSLTFLRPGRLEWREAAAPRLQGPGEALVRPVSVARCDLDRAVLYGEAPFRGAFLHFLRNHLPPAVGQRGLFRNAPFKATIRFEFRFDRIHSDSIATVPPAAKSNSPAPHHHGVSITF